MNDRFDRDELRGSFVAEFDSARERMANALGDGGEDVDFAAVFAAIDWDGLSDRIRPAFERAARQSLVSSAAELGVDVPSSVSLDNKISDIVDNVLRNMKRFSRRIRSQLGSESGADPLEANLGDWVIDFIISTESRSLNDGVFLALTQVLHVPGVKTWNTMKDPKVRDPHWRLERVTVDRDGFFNMDGHRAEYPGDSSLPWELKANCRCWLTFTKLSPKDNPFSDKIVGENSVSGSLSMKNESLEALREIAGLRASGKTFEEIVSDMSSDDKTIMYLETDSGDERISAMFDGLFLEGSPGSVFDILRVFDKSIEFKVSLGAVMLASGKTPAEVTDLLGFNSTFITQSIISDEMIEAAAVGLDNGLSSLETVFAISTEDKAEFYRTPDTIDNIDDPEEDDDDSLEEGLAVESNLWKSLLAVEGVETGDGRMIAKGALTWRNLPLPLMFMHQNPVGGDGHDGAVVAGRIDEIWRDGDNIWGSGVYDDSAAGMECKRLVDAKMMRGVSVDLDAIEIEMSGDEEDFLDALIGGSTRVFSKARIMAVTVCPMPAFAEAYIETIGNDMALVASGHRPTFRYHLPVGEDGLALVACGCENPAYPVKPPAAWFEKPVLSEAVPLQVTAEGRVFGCVADVNACHIGFPGKCVKVPREGDLTFKKFNCKSVLTAEGTIVRTGTIVDGGTHPLDVYGRPDLRLSADSAQAHYSTLDAVADVRLFWDPKIGILAAGALRPDVSEAQVRRLRGSDVSPDWRPVDGRRELVGLVTVNVSGFITDEPLGLVASGGVVGWDVELDEPLAALGTNIVHRRQEWHVEVELLKEAVDRLTRQVFDLRAKQFAAVKKQLS